MNTQRTITPRGKSRARWKAIATVIAIALILAACGGGEESDDAAASGTAEVPEAQEQTSTTERASTTAPTTDTTAAPELPAPDEPTSPITAVRLSDDEAPRFGAQMGEANTSELLAFLQDPDDDGEPFYMVNMIRYRDQAEYEDGRETDLTGEEADAIYGSFMGETMLPRYGHKVMYTADVEGDLIAGTAWDQVAVVRYASREAFTEMSQDPEFQEMSIHKDAGVLDTLVLATTLIETSQTPPLENPPFPATDDDTVMALMHVLDYRDTAEYQPGDADADPNRSGRDAVDLYTQNADSVAGPLGVQPAIWLKVEATTLGPAGVWDEVRINLFPSHATFDALTSDPAWQAGTHHRTAGLEQTFAIMNQPFINEFNGMVAAVD